MRGACKPPCGAQFLHEKELQLLSVKVPLQPEEVDKILKRASGDTVRHAIDLSEGDAVVIIDGPFKDLEGKVGEIDEERGKVKVLVPMFGRETPVELEADQVQRV